MDEQLTVHEQVDNDGTLLCYIVEGAVNTLRYRIGQEISKKTLEQLIEIGTDVIIK